MKPGASNFGFIISNRSRILALKNRRKNLFDGTINFILHLHRSPVNTLQYLKNKFHSY